MGDKNANDTTAATTDQLPDGLEQASPEDSVEGQSFYNPGTVGSGTRTPDGLIAPPAADPAVGKGVYVSAGPRTERLRGGDPLPEESGPTDAERSAAAETADTAPAKKTAPAKRTSTEQ